MPQSQDLVYISSASAGTADPVQAIERLLPITSNIELTGGGEYDARLLTRLTSFQVNHSVNLLVHNYFPPPQRHFVLNFADCGEDTRSFITHSMEFVQSLTVPYYSVHAGFRGDFRADRNGLLHRQSERVYSLEGIRENVSWFHAQWPDTPLALENIYPNNGNTSCAFMMSLEEICEALDAIPNACLLLDLGHLNVSAKLMGFDYVEAVAAIFGRYGHRILELHLSENGGLVDDHLPVRHGSLQYSTVREYAVFIRRLGIKVTLETRAASFDALVGSFALISGLLDDAARQ